jgi:cell division protein FtsB
MKQNFQYWAVLFLALISYLSYQLLLGSRGYLEREELRKELAQTQFELDRLQEENHILLERKKINLDETQLLEKEARKYYLVRKDTHIIKFLDLDESSNDWEDRDQRNFWKRLWESRVKIEKVPPLDVLRVFHISFSIFLCLGVYLKLRPGYKGIETKSV